MTLKEKRRIDQLRHGIVPEGYKRTKVGICPEDWVENVLGDIYTERKEPGKEGLPLLMVSIHSGVSDGEVGEKDFPKRFKRIEDKSQYKRAVVGDLVFNMMRAWQGAIGSVRTEGIGMISARHPFSLRVYFGSAFTRMNGTGFVV